MFLCCHAPRQRCFHNACLRQPQSSFSTNVRPLQRTFFGVTTHNAIPEAEPELTRAKYNHGHGRRRVFEYLNENDVISLEQRSSRVLSYGLHTDNTLYEWAGIGQHKGSYAGGFSWKLLGFRLRATPGLVQPSNSLQGCQHTRRLHTSSSPIEDTRRQNQVSDEQQTVVDASTLNSAAGRWHRDESDSARLRHDVSPFAAQNIEEEKSQTGIEPHMIDIIEADDKLSGLGDGAPVPADLHDHQGEMNKSAILTKRDGNAVYLPVRPVKILAGQAISSSSTTGSAEASLHLSDTQKSSELLQASSRTSKPRSAKIISGDIVLQINGQKLKVRKRRRFQRLKARFSIRASWYRYYNLIFRYDQQQQSYRVLTDVLRFGSTRKLRDFALAFMPPHSSPSMHLCWRRLPWWLRSRLVAPLLVGSLLVSARHFFEVLETLKKLPGSKDRVFTIRMECLHYLDLTRRDEIEADETSRRHRLTQLEKLSEPEQWPVRGLIRPWLDLLIKGQYISKADSVAVSYLERFPHSSPEEVLYLVDFWIRRLNIEQAVNALAHLPLAFLMESNDDLLIRCTKLLRFDSVERSGDSYSFRLLPKILALGIRPNTFMHNQILKKALDEGQDRVAWDLYHYMKVEGIELRPATCLLLLKAAFTRGKANEMQQLMSDIHNGQELSRHANLLIYQMHIVTKLGFHDRGSTSKAIFSHLLVVYDRAWDRTPLVRLGLTTMLPSDKDGPPLLEPDPRSLSFVLWSYLLSQRHQSPLKSFWKTFQSFVEAGDQTMVEVAKHDVIYNGLILTFARRRSGMKYVLEVLDYMLHKDLCRPSHRTWDMLICALLHFRQYADVEYVITQMRSRGIAIDAAQWQELLNSNSPEALVGRIKSTLDEWAVAEQLQSTLTK